MNMNKVYHKTIFLFVETCRKRTIYCLAMTIGNRVMTIYRLAMTIGNRVVTICRLEVKFKNSISQARRKLCRKVLYYLKNPFKTITRYFGNGRFPTINLYYHKQKQL